MEGSSYPFTKMSTSLVKYNHNRSCTLAVQISSIKVVSISHFAPGNAVRSEVCFDSDNKKTMIVENTHKFNCEFSIVILEKKPGAYNL